MPRRNLPTRMLLAASGAVVLALALVPLAATSTNAAPPPTPLRTAIAYTQAAPADDAVALDRVKLAGAWGSRVSLYWPTIATRQPVNPANPADTAYSWTAYDDEIKRMAARGLEPLVMVSGTPLWARGNSGGQAPPPTPAALAAFVQAAVTRYSGSFQTLPRVKYWQLWAEPNIDHLLSPQYLGTRPLAPRLYRAMLNAVAPVVHSVSGNLLVAGGLAPFGYTTASKLTMSPLKFMRSMLCLSAGTTPHSVCTQRTSFDIWAMHPYTKGNAWHPAGTTDDVSIAEIPQMQKLIDAATKAHHIDSLDQKPIRYWVTEFSWDSKPPVTSNTSSTAVDKDLEVSWVSEALFRMWLFKVELVTWLSLRDVAGAPAGLYFQGPTPPTFANDTPKPALAAFRAPFIAYPYSGGVLVWGRTPGSTAGTVTIQRKNTNSTWTAVGTAPANSVGIYIAVLPTPANGVLRAWFSATSVSAQFTVAAPHDMRLP